MYQNVPIFTQPKKQIMRPQTLRNLLVFSILLNLAGTVNAQDSIKNIPKIPARSVAQENVTTPAQAGIVNDQPIDNTLKEIGRAHV